MEQKNRLVYALLAFFFGFLGVHCYYAGNKIKALIRFIFGILTILLIVFAHVWIGFLCYVLLFIWAAADAFTRTTDSIDVPMNDDKAGLRFGFSIAGFVALPVIAALVGIVVFLIPALSDSQEKIDLRNCVGNLNEIGSTYQMYALQNGGHYLDLAKPEEFQKLVKSNNHINYLICQANTKQRYPYIFLGGYKKPVNGRMPIAVERIGNHPGFINVLLADGTVLSFESKEVTYISLAARLHEDLGKREFEELKRKLRELDAAVPPVTAYSVKTVKSKNAKPDAKKPAPAKKK